MQEKDFIVIYIYGTQTEVSGKNMLEALSKVVDINNVIDCKQK